MVNNRWARLSQNEKAELLGIYTSMGYNDLASIIAHYNSCGGKLKADGGPVTNTAQYKSDAYLYTPPVNVGAPIEVPLRYKPLPDYGDYVPQRTTGMLEDIPIEMGLETPRRGYGVLMPDAPSAIPTLDARQDAARRIMAVENSKNNVNGGYDAKAGRWYPHKSHEGGADTIAYGIKLSNGTPEAALALKQGYLTDEQAVSAVDSLVQKYYDAAKRVYDGKYGSGEWDKLSDKSQSILVDYSYNPGLAKFPKLMEGFHSGNLDLIRKNYKRYSGGKELGRNKVLLEELDTLENEYPIFRAEGGNLFGNGGPENKKFHVRDNTRVNVMPRDYGYIPATESPTPDRSKIRLDEGVTGYLPIAGDVLQGAQAVEDFLNKDYWKAALNAGMIFLPNTIEKVGKTGVRLLRNSNIRNVGDLYHAAEQAVIHGSKRNKFLNTEFGNYPEFAEFLQRTGMEPSQKAVDEFAKVQGTSVRGTRVSTQGPKRTTEDLAKWVNSLSKEEKERLTPFNMAKFLDYQKQLSEEEISEITDFYLTHSPYHKDAGIIKKMSDSNMIGADALSSNGIYSSNSMGVAKDNASIDKALAILGERGYVGDINVPLIYDKNLPIENQISQIMSNTFNYDDIISGSLHGAYSMEGELSRAAEIAGYKLGDHEYTTFKNGLPIHERTTLGSDQTANLINKVEVRPDLNSTWNNRYGLRSQPLMKEDSKYFIPKVTTERDIESVADILSWLTNSYGNPIFNDGGELYANGGPELNSGWNIGASIINKIKQKYISDYADKGYVYSYPSNPFELLGYAISPYARTSEYGNYMLDVMPKNITDARRALFAKNFGVNSDGKGYENAIVESRYRPTISSNPNAKYYTLPIDDPRARFEDLQSVIGTAKYDFGEDENGKYISVYDKWDLAPITDKGSDFLNATPPEIYDRFYQSDVPEIYNTYLNPNFDSVVGGTSGMDFSSGGKIHIKPENRGKFTALKKRTGHSASWFKAHGTPAQKKMATFALNARKWKHEDGGPLREFDNISDIF